MKKILSAILLALFLVGSTPSFAFATSGSATSSDIASLLSQISALMRQIEELKAQAKSIRGEVKNISKENKNHDDDRDDDHGRKEKRTVLIPCPDNGGTYTAKWNVFNGKGKHKGEYKKYTRYCRNGQTGTSTDTTAPSISSIAVSNITSSGATITWTTDENANTVVAYGTTTNYGATSTNLSFVKTHSITLTGLSANTLYNFQVRSADVAGNLVVSSNASFTTNTQADVIAPVISSVAVSNITASGATITWTTNEAADSQVVYGTTSAYGSTTTLDATLVTNHSVVLTGLSSSTLYHIAVRSKDAATNLAVSSDVAFTTSAPVDTTAPTISGISATVGSTTATINWATNENSTTKVYYSTTTPLVFGSALIVSNGSLVASHSAPLVSLSASTTYYYVVESADALNNISTSSQQSFTTGN